MRTNHDNTQFTLSDYQLDVVRIKLVKDRTIFSDQPLNSPDAAVDMIGRELAEWDREAMLVLNLDTKNNVINMHVVSIGTINYSVTTMRELIKASVLSNASSMIMMHNHPSGDVSPSEEDIEITGNIVAIGKLIGIEVLDHIIVGSDPSFQFFSFNNNDMLIPSDRINLIDDATKKNMAAEKRTARKRSR